jgi:UDP-N-acetylmuramoyl-tripeptide--D-alanyl-D-alanine ligase
MIQQSLKWAAGAMGASLQGAAAGVIFSGVSTDSRTLKKGELFFCLRGKRDGHQFAKSAAAAGAAAVVAEQDHLSIVGELPEATPVLPVADTLKALGDLAHAWREGFSIPVLAITGSNGKTTTKELVRNLLASRYRVLATEGNLNNLIGVPHTLFQLEPKVEIAVIEMGMNDFGEIARLTEVTRPTLGLITNVGPAHLEKLGDLKGVARAKGELFAGLSAEARALVNLKDPWVASLPTPAHREGYGTPESGLWGEILPAPHPDSRPLHLRIHMGKESCGLALQLAGAHNLDNILGALAVGRHFGLSLAEAKTHLEKFNPAPARMELVTLKNRRKLLDDSYNANPSSMVAALKTLAEIKGSDPGLAILGDMMELGKYCQEGHRALGREAALQKIDYLVAIGDYAEEIRTGAREAGLAADRIRVFRNVDEATANLGEPPPGVLWILVKGSRANHLEKLVSQLKESN